MKDPLSSLLKNLAMPAVVFVFFSANAFGATTPLCGTTTYNLGNSGTDALVSGGGASAGCLQIDKFFQNFTYTNSPSFATGGADGPAGSAVDVAFSGNTSPGTISDAFGTPGTATWSLGGGNVSGSEETNTVTVNPATSNGATITQAVLSTNGSSNSGSNTTTNFVAVVEEFCTGSATFNCSSSSSNFGIIEYVLVPTGTGGGSNTYSGSCYGGGAVCQQLAADQSSASTTGFSTTDLSLGTAGLTLNLPGITSLTVENIVEIHGGLAETLDAYDNEWVQTAQATPEPSTLLLSGIALFGLGAFVRRRKSA